MRWTSIPSGKGEGGSRNTPSYATETGISVNLMGHLAHMQTLIPLWSCFLPWPLFRTNARAKHFTWKWLDFQGNKRTGDMTSHANSFAQSFGVLSLKQRSTIHLWADSESHWFLTWFGHDNPAGQFVSVRSFHIAATTWYSGFFLLSLVTRFACDTGQLAKIWIWVSSEAITICI